MTHRSRPPALRDLVTDHALVRYIERVLGIDLEQVRAQILPPTMLPAVRAIGNGKLPSGDSEHYLVITDGRVVTVSERSIPKPHKLRPHYAVAPKRAR